MICPVTGKHSHATAKAAGRHRARVKDPGLTETYYCPHCQGFHVGHVPGKGWMRRTDKKRHA